MVNRWSRPWLFLPPALAHHWAPLGIHLAAKLLPSQPTPTWRSFVWRNLHFPNRLGISGGVDKDCRNVQAWARLGAGFLELGTVTPKPQPGNSGTVIGRDLAHQAVWNRLGFPSKGLAACLKNLQAGAEKPPVPLFMNIGKNATTPAQEAAQDYVRGLEGFLGAVDGFVINISSPNTKGLRDLLKEDSLREFLHPIAQFKQKRAAQVPFLLKLSPDMTREMFRAALKISNEMDIDGWIVTNTSLGLREGLSFPPEGGVSGEPLRLRSRECLQWAIEDLGSRRRGKLLISSGGISTAEEVITRLDAGADLVQVYSALIFEGPLFFRRIATKIKA